jgi:hypothetical protein
MLKFAKDVVVEIRKSVIQQIVSVLGLILLALSPTVRAWALRLSLSDSQVSSIRYWLFFSGSIALISVSWILFFHTFRRLRLLERQLSEALSRPQQFRDDCTFDKRLGLYRHKSKPEFFCGTCTPQDIESPLKELPQGWQCLIDSNHWHPNPDYHEPPTSSPIQPIGPNDPGFF